MWWDCPAGQRSIKAESAAIIYAMDPVYAAGFSFFLLGAPASIMSCLNNVRSLLPWRIERVA